HVREPSGWKEGGPWPGPQQWSAAVGTGGTSPVVVEGRLYVLGWQADREHVRCLDAATGKEVWTTSYSAPEYGRFHVGDENSYSGPCATPEYDPATGFLYTLGIDGDL